MNLSILAVSVIFAALNNIFLHLYNEKKTTCNIFAFNALVCLIWVVILFIIGGGIGSMSVTTLLYGILYGITIALFLLFKMSALGNGPVSITSLIGCCSLIIPTLCGLIVWEESFNILQIFGLIFLFVALYLCVDPKSNVKISKKWIFLCIAFFLCAGANGTIMKAYNKTDVNSEINSMMIITSFTAFIVFALIYLSTGLYRVKRGQSFIVAENMTAIKRSAIFIILCGIVSCGYQRLNMFLTGVLSALIFFPVFNGMVIILSCLSGRILFKEKLSKKQLTGIIVGMFSIMLIGNVFEFLL